MKYLPLILGIACLVGTSYQFYRATRLLITGQRVEGQVIRNEQTSHKSTAYYPVVRFSAGDGQTHECRGMSGSYPAEYDVNDSVVVHYDPSQPTDAFIGGFFGLLSGTLLTLGLGAVFAWLGLYIVRRKRPDATNPLTA